MSTYPLPQQEPQGAQESVALQAPAHEAHHAALGVDSKKIGMWLFIASDCMFFGALIGTYLIYAGKSTVGPYPQDLFDIPLTTVSTFILLMSSLAMAMAVHGAQHGDMKKLKRWLGLTILMGLTFLGFQVYEYSHFIAAGLTLSRNLFGTTFYVLTGTHGVHVALGVLWLTLLFITALRGDTKRVNPVNVEIAGLYWHFVDIVWIVVFAVVYLMADVAV